MFDIEKVKAFLSTFPAEKRAKLLQVFRDEFLQYHTKCIQMHSEKDYAALQRTVHAMKSSARTIGAVSLGNLAATLEIDLKDVDEGKVEQGMAQVIAALIDVIAVLDDCA